MITREKFYEACTILNMMGVTEFRCTPELFVALARHHERTMEEVTGTVVRVYLSDDDLVDSGRVPYYRGSPFRIAKEFR